MTRDDFRRGDACAYRSVPVSHHRRAPLLSSSRAKYRVPLYSPHETPVMCMPMCGCAMAEIIEKKRKKEKLTLEVNTTTREESRNSCSGKFFSPTECTCVSASARQSRESVFVQSRAPVYIKIKTSRARAGSRTDTSPPLQDFAKAREEGASPCPMLCEGAVAYGKFFCTCASASARQSRAQRKKENRQPKGGMGGDGTPPPHRDFKERSPVRKKERKHTTQGSPVPSVVRKILFPTCIPGMPPGVYL